jgi:hypothetical protein
MRTLLPALVSLSLPACVVYDNDVGGGGRAPANAGPFIEWADAACGWDDGYRDFVWTFEAEVTDWDGDVVTVVADVYDTWDGRWVDGFELGWDPGYGTWFSDWIGGLTALDCGYPDYVVDFTAIDGRDAQDVVTVYPVVF